MKQLSENVSWGLGGTAHQNFNSLLLRLIDESGARSVCEIGAGAKPALPLDLIQQRGLDYTAPDISATELAKAREGYTNPVARREDYTNRLRTTMRDA